MKTTAYYLLCLLMLLLLSVYTCLSAKAQDGDTNPTNIYNHTDLSIGFMTTPSPDAGAMIKYGKADVNPYTGTVGLSIPVFTYTDADFNIPIFQSRLIMRRRAISLTLPQVLWVWVGILTSVVLSQEKSVVYAMKRKVLRKIYTRFQINMWGTLCMSSRVPRCLVVGICIAIPNLI